MDSLPFLYKTTFGRILLKPLTAPSLSKFCGRFLDSKLSAFLIKGFVKNNSIAVEDYQTEGIKTFNEFFRRKIKDGLRPFDMTPSKLCAPCDGLLSIWNIEEADGTVIPAFFNISILSETPSCNSSSIAVTPNNIKFFSIVWANSSSFSFFL